MRIFNYGEKETTYLKSRDPVLGQFIDEVGMLQRKIHPDLFEGLVRSIIAQQISSKAANTVWSRLLDYVGDLTPEKLSSIQVSDIQKQGMSMRKATYIHHIANMVMEGTFDLNRLKTLPDEDVKKTLITLPGIGIWTAEMLMIFSLERQDILSWDDLGIRRGMMRLYGMTTLDRDIFEKNRKKYSPYGSVASLYLWEIASPK